MNVQLGHGGGVGDGQVKWLRWGVMEVLIDVRAIAERVRAYGEADSAPRISGAVPTRLAVVAAELESALRSQLVLDSLGARRISGEPAGEGTDTPGCEWIELDLPAAPSFVLYPEPGPSERAQVLGAAADTLAHGIRMLDAAANGQVAIAAAEELGRIKDEIRQFAESLVASI